MESEGWREGEREERAAGTNEGGKAGVKIREGREKITHTKKMRMKRMESEGWVEGGREGRAMENNEGVREEKTTSEARTAKGKLGVWKEGTRAKEV